MPPYVVNNPDSPDGFGDWQFLVKYRIAAGNEQHGNYIMTAFFQMSLDVQGTLGISLPTGNTMANRTQPDVE